MKLERKKSLLRLLGDARRGAPGARARLRALWLLADTLVLGDRAAGPEGLPRFRLRTHLGLPPRDKP